MPHKLIGYARVSTNAQDSDRQVADLLKSGVRQDDLYIDNGVSGAKASRPQFNLARQSLQAGDTLVVTTLDRLGRSTEAMLALSKELEDKGINLRVLNLGGEHVDTSSPMGKMMFTVMTALAQMELDIKTERNRDSVAKRRANGKDLGGRREKYSADLIHGALADIQKGVSASEAVSKRGMSRQTFYRRVKELGLEVR
ncbi:recombinase family protein [Glutamicibacter sp. NPDC127525]|uniref:recombinase family protein n=1 Tax=unclassified Glutamicibacter TaxID=2627139 RepID=UPI003624F679